MKGFRAGTAWVVALIGLMAAGCGSSSAGGGPVGAGAAAPGTHASRGHGAVAVLYAGSLVNLMERDLGPAFSRATGYAFEGVGAGSTELVQQIKGGVRQGDVFISASPKANLGLEGAAGGGFVSWYARFAQAPLVIAYRRSSRFAARFARRPWYDVLAEPGIRVGITDPKLDPKGKLTVQAIDAAAAQLERPALRRLLGGFSVFPEESLVGRLEAGQLDAGFFYANEASEQHLPTVSLAPVRASATYTVSVLQHARDRAGAAAFVAFLLGAQGRSSLVRHGLTVLRPSVVGLAGGVPARLRTLLHAG